MSYDARWKILHELGKGGQGTVFLVEDKLATKESDIRNFIGGRLRTLVQGMVAGPPTDETIGGIYDLFRGAVQGQIGPHKGALKILNDLPKDGDGEKASKRIKNEIAAIADIKHTNVIKLLDQSPDGNWFVSEYFEHGTLTQMKLLYAGDFHQSLRAIRPLISALADIHENNFVHRDVKPDNIFYCPNRGLVLGDLGLIFKGDKPEQRLTKTHENAGSWEWMPPWTEYIRVEDVRPSFDVFAVAKVLWAMVSGKEKLPFWWWHKDNNNLVNIFPDSPEMKYANDLFSKCIVEEEDACLKDCSELLKIVDQLIDLLEAANLKTRLSGSKLCLVCGSGTYENVTLGDRAAVESYGLKLGDNKSFSIYICNTCGHFQLFYQSVGRQGDYWDKTT